MVSQADIKRAARIIKGGGLVAFPTETVYGLGADALNPIAVAKIFQMKERPSFNPLIVHIASMDDLRMLTESPGRNAIRLAERFWPGPLTIVLPKSKLVPALVTSGLPTVGVRMPGNETALRLIREAKRPIAAPSANKFGRISPVSAEHVRKQLPLVDYILDGGTTTVGIESTIVAIEGNVCTLLRPGVITVADIEKALPDTFVFKTGRPGKPISPGSMKSHYSPAKPLRVLNKRQTRLPDSSGLILNGEKVSISNAMRVIYTSHTYDHLEIAANLYSALHAMDDDEAIRQVFIEPIEECGLGIAIMDRIKKAAYKHRPGKRKPLST